MARPAKSPSLPIEPMFEPSDIPSVSAGAPGKAKPADSFRPIMEKVRQLNGQSALIVQHAKVVHLIRHLKDAFPDCDFVSRRIKQDGNKHIFGVWARLKEKTDAPSPNELQSGT